MPSSPTPIYPPTTAVLAPRWPAPGNCFVEVCSPPSFSLFLVLTVSTEVEHQLVAVQRLSAAYEAVERLYPSQNNVALHRCYLVRHAQVLKLRNDELAKQRAELEGEAGMAAILEYQPDVSTLLVD